MQQNGKSVYHIVSISVVSKLILFHQVALTPCRFVWLCMASCLALYQLLAHFIGDDDEDDAVADVAVAGTYKLSEYRGFVLYCCNMMMVI